MPGTSKGRLAMRRGLASLSIMLGVSALADTATAQSRRHAALVVDGNSGRVISESSADEPRYPASLTKMMTLYVVFDLIEQGKLRLETRINFSEAATRVQPTKLGIPAGGSITVLEAAKALITKSANDASVALAEHIAGSEAKFAALMTQTARRIGMKGSTFMNAHGLPDSEQVTTARDMITLGLRLQDDFPKHYALFSLREFTHNGSSHRNHNTMLLTYEGTDGIKTGYIGSSGFNLVANVRRGDKHVIGVVFGGATAGQRNTTMKTLLNMALFKASSVKTRNTVPLARAKPVPAPANVPAPAVASRPMPAAPVRIETALQPRVVAATRVAATAPVVVAQASAEAPAEPEIQMARVKPLLVAPRQPRQAALPDVVTAAPQQAPAAVVIQPPPMAAGFAPAGAAPQRGAPPSTLQAQAASMPVPARGYAAAAPPPGGSRLNGPMAAPVAPASVPPSITSVVHLQVGAFATKAEADRHLAQVQAQAANSVGALQTVTLQAVNGGKTVFRARFTGVDAAAAGNICNDLRRRQIDCMVARAE